MFEDDLELCDLELDELVVSADLIAAGVCSVFAVFLIESLTGLIK